MLLRCSDKCRDTGLLILRVGVGLMFMGHGCPKIFGGPEKWEALGGAMKSVGIGFAPTFWGFMAAFSEFVGGALLALGLLTLPACALLLVTMVVATAMHLGKGDPFTQYSHGLEAAILFLSLILIGPGKYAVDSLICRCPQASAPPRDTSAGDT